MWNDECGQNIVVFITRWRPNDGCSNTHKHKRPTPSSPHGWLLLSFGYRIHRCPRGDAVAPKYKTKTRQTAHFFCFTPFCEPLSVATNRHKWLEHNRLSTAGKCWTPIRRHDTHIICFRHSIVCRRPSLSRIHTVDDLETICKSI